MLLTSTGRFILNRERSYRPPNEPISDSTARENVARAMVEKREIADIFASTSTPASRYDKPVREGIR